MPHSLPKKSFVSHDPSISAVGARPDLAVYIARVATGWSHLEERIGYLIVQLLGAHAHTGMKMYQALSSSAAQLSVLRAVARDTLSNDDQLQMEAILASYKKTARKRNNVVHGHWHVSEQHPKDLVWCDSADDLLFYSEFWSVYSSLEASEVVPYFRDHYKEKRPNYLIYKQSDFEDILAEMARVFADLSAFVLKMRDLKELDRDKSSLGG